MFIMFFKLDQHCTQPLLSQKKGALTRGGGCFTGQNLADTRGAYSKGAHM